jgi:carbon monoxide dehydrogenase subunit G
MHLSGEHRFSAPRERVYAFLLDPETLRSCLPGCEQLDEISKDEYSATMKIGIGMIKGTFTGKVQISDRNEPSSYRMLVEGRGPQGQVSGEGVLELFDDEGGTLVKWAGDANVRGTLARIGSRVIQPAAATIVGQFFKCLESKAAATQQV